MSLLPPNLDPRWNIEKLIEFLNGIQEKEAGAVAGVLDGLEIDGVPFWGSHHGAYAANNGSLTPIDRTLSLRQLIDDLNQMMDHFDLNKKNSYRRNRSLFIPINALAPAFEPPLTFTLPTFSGLPLSVALRNIIAPGPEPSAEEIHSREQLMTQNAFAAIDRVNSRPATLLSQPASNPSDSTAIPDYTHTLTGWRAWDTGHLCLESIGHANYWSPRMKVAARCLKGRQHPVPNYHCSCGYWSFKSLDNLKKTLGLGIREYEVIGTVEIWGRVIECENGFRSEFAYPKELLLMRSGLEWLSWTYGVPVKMINQIDCCP